MAQTEQRKDRKWLTIGSLPVRNSKGVDWKTGICFAGIGRAAGLCPKAPRSFSLQQHASGSFEQSAFVALGDAAILLRIAANGRWPSHAPPLAITVKRFVCEFHSVIGPPAFDSPPCLGHDGIAALGASYLKPSWNARNRLRANAVNHQRKLRSTSDPQANFPDENAHRTHPYRADGQQIDLHFRHANAKHLPRQCSSR